MVFDKVTYNSCHLKWLSKCICIHAFFKFTYCFELFHNMSSRLLQQYLNMQRNLLLFTTDISMYNSVQLKLAYRILSNCNIFIRSTYSLDDNSVLLNIFPNANLLEIIDLVQELLDLSGHSWSFNSILYKVTIQKAFDVNVNGEIKVKDYAIFIEEGILWSNSLFTYCNFKFNMFYGFPMESSVFTPIQLSVESI